MNDNDAIEFIRKQFLCCISLNKFLLLDSLKEIDINTQKRIINATVNSELALKYPMKQSYKKSFLKLFIKKLEQSGVEIADIVYNTYCNVIASSNESSTLHYRHFLFNDTGTINCLSIKESTSIISQGTTGLCSWKAAFYLAEWCMIHKHEFKGTHILELGSGVGLTGLTIIKFCAPKLYYFSDGHSIVLKILEENIRFNILKHEKTYWKEVTTNNGIEFQMYDMNINIINLKWEEIDKSIANQIDVDVIIAADILYDSCAFESLVLGLNNLISTCLKYAIIAVTVRNELTVQIFLNILVKYNLLCEEETPFIPQVFIECDDTPVRIFKIKKKNK